MNMKILESDFELNWNEYLKTQRPIIIYGAGSSGRQAKQLLEKESIEINCFVDKNSNIWNKIIEKYPIHSPEILTKNDFVVIASMFWREIAETLSERNIKFVTFNFIRSVLLKNKLDLPFKKVVFEISGKCNANCPYCITGIKSQTGNFVDFEGFKRTITNLFDSNLVNQETEFDLYNWGEPLLHPDFIEIINFLSSKNIIFNLSSNLSIIPKNIETANFNSLKTFGISMPGFSQESYDRIHGFNFEKIIENIFNISNIVPKDKLMIYLHIYRFNYHEIKKAIDFFKSLNIKVFPYYAYIANFDLAIKYLEKTLDNEYIQKIKKDLFLSNISEYLDEMPSYYRCDNFDSLTIDENFNVITCCVLPKKSNSYKVCNIDDIDNNLFDKLNKKACKICYSSKYVYWVHNPQHYTISNYQENFLISP